MGGGSNLLRNVFYFSGICLRFLISPSDVVLLQAKIRLPPRHAHQTRKKTIKIIIAETNKLPSVWNAIGVVIIIIMIAFNTNDDFHN